MSYNPFTLEGKTILITGASGGIGGASALECVKMGASVIATGRNVDRLEALLLKLNSIHNNNFIYVCDVADEADIKNLAAQVPELDGLVLNAGIGKISPIKFINSSDFERILKVNLVSQSLLLKELLKKKKIKNGGSVVFTASMAGKDVPKPGEAMYGASKSAVSAFAKVAAIELAARKIRVNTVCPGVVNTMMTAGLSDLEYSKDGGVSEYPLGRYGEPKDIALAFVYLLSDASAWITGTDLVIDGGLHIG